MRELFPWAACRKRPGPAVPPFDWGTIAQVATAEAKRVPGGVRRETPAKEPPMSEAPVTDPSCPDTPAPMETGGAGDGQT